MLSPHPQTHIRACRATRREHLFCAAVLSAVVALLSALLLVLAGNPYTTRFPPVTRGLTVFAFAALAVMIALSLVRGLADAWQALVATREIQYQTWGALSLAQEAAR